MPARIFTIPFDPRQEVFADEELQQFLLNKRVTTLRPEFFQTRGKAYWCVFVEYESVWETPEPNLDLLQDAQRLQHYS